MCWTLRRSTTPSAASTPWRAIQENELQNRIELAVREEKLIVQQGANERRRSTEDAESKRIGAEAKAARTRIDASAQGEQITVVESAQVGAERERMAIYRDLPAPVMLGLAARELATHLEHIDHLSITPELFGPLLTQLLTTHTARLADGD